MVHFKNINRYRNAMVCVDLQCCGTIKGDNNHSDIYYENVLFISVKNLQKQILLREGSFHDHT